MRPSNAGSMFCVPAFVGGDTIYVRADTDVYRGAAAEDYQALVRLPGILSHERWHLRYGRDEVGAYAAQLAMMEYLGASSVSLAAVRMALQRVTRATNKARGTAAPGGTGSQPR